MMEIDIHKNRIHRILAHSYLVYFILFLVSVWLDFVFKIRIFSGLAMTSLGFILLVFASVLIFWAQKSSLGMVEKENVSKETFCKGPYCYTRHPTHWGLFFLILGFGIIANAFFVVLFTLVSFLITRFVFLNKHEKILEEKYGVPYVEYKKSVKI